MIQAKFVDLDVYFRHGGVDALKAKNFDLLLIQAGVGLWINPLLQEQIALAKSIGKPYATFHIPDGDVEGSITYQVEKWAAQPGVLDGVMVPDIEKPGQEIADKLVTFPQLKEYLNRASLISKRGLVVYSRVETLTKLFAGQFPSWWSYPLIIAQYLYEGLDEHGNGVQFTRYDPFLLRWGSQLPPSVVNSPMFGPWEQSLVIGWQISEKGDAQYYIANAKTQDPNFPNGISHCDLGVSTIDRSQFMGTFICSDPTPPPMIPKKVVALVQDQNVRASPATSAPSVGKLVRGYQYAYTGEVFAPGVLDNSWLQIILPDGTIGWAAIQYGRTVYLRTV